MIIKAFPLKGLGALLLLIMLISTPPVHGGSNRKPFEFLQHLQGCRKGETVAGVQQLKQYLQKFGYLHYSDQATHANDDEYDDLVESAVKTYQFNYHLNQTGSLDSQTLNEMMKPRCGVADIINGTTRMRSGKKHLSLHTVSHFSFFSGNPRWPASKMNLTYKFRSTVRVIDLRVLRPLISRAFAKWAAVSQFKFSEAKYGSDSDMEIGFHRLDHGDNSPFNGTGGVLAHAYAPTVGAFHYDADESWSTNPDPSMNEFDLESIAIHEIGHLLGLGHSEFPDAVMWGSYAAGARRRVLAQDDIQGIQTLYGLTR